MSLPQCLKRKETYSLISVTPLSGAADSSLKAKSTNQQLGHLTRWANYRMKKRCSRSFKPTWLTKLPDPTFYHRTKTTVSSKKSVLSSKATMYKQECPKTARSHTFTCNLIYRTQKTIRLAKASLKSQMMIALWSSRLNLDSIKIRSKRMKKIRK